MESYYYILRGYKILGNLKFVNKLSDSGKKKAHSFVLFVGFVFCFLICHTILSLPSS